MVFFNCNGCGEALKKNQVEKHTYRCRQCQVVSCVDCGKDFWGNDYQTHTKCMTENEKYCGKGYVAKVNKGEVKQEKWIETVQNAIEQSSSDPKLKGLLERLQDYPNIPRKKAKFENFLKNSMRILNPYLITQVWNILMEQTKTETADNAETKPTESSPAPTKTDITEISEKANGVHYTDENEPNRNLSKREKKEQRQKKNKKEKKDKPILENNDENVLKTKKRKSEDLEDDIVEEKETFKKAKKKKKKTDVTQEQSVQDSIEISKEDGRLNDTLVRDSSNENVKFKWGATIVALVEKKGEISYKKLRRKILQEFASQEGANFKEESIQIKFDKKLRKLSQSQLVVTDGRISMR